MKNLKGYETYPLSPLQEGMLFHALSKIGSGVDIEQIIFTVHETIDLQAFEGAWERVIERHGILRSGFEWEGIGEPLQFVEDSVNFSLEQVSPEGIPGARQGEEIDTFIDKDRLNGFNMRKPPLMRLTVFNLNERKLCTLSAQKNKHFLSTKNYSCLNLISIGIFTSIK